MQERSAAMGDVVQEIANSHSRNACNRRLKVCARKTTIILRVCQLLQLRTHGSALEMT
jgi:hypothetical protein